MKRRFGMVIEEDFQRRLDDLSKLKGINLTSVVKLAVAEMHQREFPLNEKGAPSPKTRGGRR